MRGRTPSLKPMTRHSLWREARWCNPHPNRLATENPGQLLRAAGRVRRKLRKEKRRKVLLSPPSSKCRASL